MKIDELDDAKMTRIRGGEVMNFSLSERVAVKMWSSSANVYLTKMEQDDTLSGGTAKGEGAAQLPLL